MRDQGHRRTCQRREGEAPAEPRSPVELWLGRSLALPLTSRLQGIRNDILLRVTVVLCLGGLLLGGFGCDDTTEKQAIAMTGGDPHRGKDAINYYGCASCHTIPGIRGANGLVGPPLDRIGSRSFIAGVLRNTPENMLRWLQNPPGVDEKTAMPNMHLSEQDTRDIASYLYTLQ